MSYMHYYTKFLILRAGDITRDCVIYSMNMMAERVGCTVYEYPFNAFTYYVKYYSMFS